MKWILNHFENDPVFSRQAEIRDGNGYFVCRLDDCPSNAIIQSDIDAGFPPDDYEREVFARNLANARLIAAAPDLLAALYDALPYVEDVLSNPAELACFKPGTVQKHAKAIRDAIARAEGDIA